MGKSSAALNAENPIRDKLSEKMDGRIFVKKPLKLSWGGDFEFDAVSVDGDMAGLISTSRSKTKSNHKNYGGIHKIRGDIVSLMGLENKSLFLVFSEESMFNEFKRLQEKKKIPPNILLLHIPLEGEYLVEVTKERERASKENRPETKTGM